MRNVASGRNILIKDITRNVCLFIVPMDVGTLFLTWFVIYSTKCHTQPKFFYVQRSWPDKHLYIFLISPPTLKFTVFLYFSHIFLWAWLTEPDFKQSSNKSNSEKGKQRKTKYQKQNKTTVQANNLFRIVTRDIWEIPCHKMTPVELPWCT